MNNFIRRKAIAVAILIVIGVVGWLRPFPTAAIERGADPMVAPLFSGAAITAWRLLPFALALAVIAWPRGRRR